MIEERPRPWHCRLTGSTAPPFARCHECFPGSRAPSAGVRVDPEIAGSPPDVAGFHLGIAAALEATSERAGRPSVSPFDPKPRVDWNLSRRPSTVSIQDSLEWPGPGPRIDQIKKHRATGYVKFDVSVDA